MSLTETEIKKIIPGPKPFAVKDMAGLVLDVRPTGRKVFVKAYRFHGKQRKDTLGEFPALTLRAARASALEINAWIKDGIDPRDYSSRFREKERLRQEKLAREAEEAPVPIEDRFETLARKFIDKRAQEGIADSTLNKLNWNLGGVATDFFKGRDIASIKPPEILKLIEDIQAEDKIEKAKDIHRKLSQVFDYAIALGMVEWNPAKMVTRAVVKKKAGHLPGVTDPRDVGVLMRAIRLYPDGAGQNTRAALVLSAYNFLRSNELRGARWKEIDLTNAIWTVPSERMKGHKGDHLVPLSRQSMTVLEGMRAWVGDDPEAFLFPMSGKTGRYMSENTLNNALRILDYDTRTQHCHHGFRTTFSTNMNEQGWNRDWIERQLAHLDKDDVRTAYNKALYMEGRREMMQAYSDWLDKMAM